MASCSRSQSLKKYIFGFFVFCFLFFVFCFLFFLFLFKKCTLNDEVFYYSVSLV